MALRGFKKRLVDNSIDAYVLSLETINRLSVKYRLESFCILLCNAWELLLKARIVDTTGKSQIYYPKVRGKKRRTLSAKDCTKEVFFNERDHIRRNLEMVIQLRDECSHLVIAKVPSDVLELLQSCVLNYHSCLRDWFDLSLSDRAPVGMMTIIYDLSPLTSDIALLGKSMGAEEVKFLTRFQSEIRDEAQALGHSRQYVAQIEHKVLVVNRPGQADVQLVGGAQGDPVQVIHKPRDPAQTHPLYEKDAISAIQGRIPSNCTFNPYSFQAMCYEMDVQKHDEWHFKLGLQGGRGQYSHALVDEIVLRINNDPSCVDRARTALTQYRRSRRTYRHAERQGLLSTRD